MLWLGSKPAPVPSHSEPSSEHSNTAPLFRPEAVQALAPRLAGDIVLLPGSGSRWIAMAATATLLGLIALLFWGRYTQRTTVVGQLLPSLGLVRVAAPQAGVLIEKRVREGQKVQRGDVLFVIDSDRLSAAGGAGAAPVQPVREQIAEQIRARRALLEQERERSIRYELEEQQALQRRAQALRAELDQTRRQGQEQVQRLAQAQDTVRRYQGLLEQGFVSRDAMLAKQADASDQQAKAREIERNALELERELADTTREQEASRARHSNQRMALDRDILSAQQSQAETQVQRTVAVVAPQAGVVGFVQADIGQTVDNNTVLAHVVPHDAPLVARLYVPSRALGTARAGDKVLIRYDAFAFQRYGQHEGRIVSVASSAAPAAELGLLGAVPAAGAGESLYAIQVELPAQHIGQGTAQRALQSGMRLEADLFQDTRRLYEWMIEPLAAVPRKVAASPSAR
jgi:membrane fusion protein